MYTGRLKQTENLTALLLTVTADNLCLFAALINFSTCSKPTAT